MTALLRTICLLGGGLYLVATAQATPAWVSDEFEVLLRTGPSTSNAIQVMLKSGAALEVLERDDVSGYSRVRTPGGTEGWVLSRYLMQEPAARQQLEALTSQLTSANATGSSMSEQLSAIRGQYAQATDSIKSLEREKESLQRQLEEIRRTAANVLAIDTQNKSLQEQLTDAEIRVNTLEQQNQELSGQKNRNWFLAGASVLVVGMLLGIWLPRVRWQRRSGYDRF
jgi:SH3 domain protein